MAEAGTIWVRIALAADGVKKGLEEAKSSLTEWRDQTNESSGDMLKWGAAITATTAPLIAFGAALIKVTDDAANFGKQLKDNARDLGMSTDEYQRWTHAAIASGSSAEEITGSIRMFSIRMKEASDTTSDAGKWMSALGVSVTDSNGRLRSTNDVLIDLLPKLNELPSGFERNQASMALFGRSFSNIADLTALNRTELEKYLAEAPIIDSTDIETMDEYKTQLALLNEQWDLFYKEVGTDLIPVMQDFLPIIRDGLDVLKDMEPTVETTARGFHIMAQEAQAFSQVMSRDTAGAKKTMMDLAEWTDAKKRDDALKAWIISSGNAGRYTTDGNGNLVERSTGSSGTTSEAYQKYQQFAIDEANKKATEGAAKEMADTISNQLKKAYEETRDAVDDYKDALQKVKDLQEDLNDINKDYAREMSITNPNDVARVRELSIRHQWAVEDKQVEIASAQSTAKAAGEVAGRDVYKIEKIENKFALYVGNTSDITKVVKDYQTLDPSLLTSMRSAGIPNRSG